MNLFKTLNSRTRTILVIQAICMLVGASTHIKWIYEHGIYSKHLNTPFFSTVFWDSLAFFDIVAAVLLIARPKTGIWLTLVIIITDVVHNNALLFLVHEHMNEIGVKMWVTKYWMLVVQILFMIFVLVTIKGNLKEINIKSTKN